MVDEVQTDEARSEGRHKELQNLIEASSKIDDVENLHRRERHARVPHHKRSTRTLPSAFSVVVLMSPKEFGWVVGCVCLSVRESFVKYVCFGQQRPREGEVDRRKRHVVRQVVETVPWSTL